MRVPDRLAGWLLVVSWSGPVLIGAAMTVSIYGAIIGLPVLLLVGRPWWVGVRFARGGSRISTAAMAHIAIAVGVGTVAFAATLAYARDDIDGMDSVAGMALGVLLVANGWAGALGVFQAWQRSRRPDFVT